ncbi:hypothetical protein HG15A2_04200 [Adhaeretor mobilis]|uniref:Uncharacterized protein n=1 Tax=Adhaeretor mobilis TaxID=1930276 RepID=A0A517MQJ5_9BACT|nr:hypothetical protein HG15A2_04200 [Adhaeretor mobilis]
MIPAATRPATFQCLRLWETRPLVPWPHDRLVLNPVRPVDVDALLDQAATLGPGKAPEGLAPVFQLGDDVPDHVPVPARPWQSRSMICRTIG